MTFQSDESNVAALTCRWKLVLAHIPTNIVPPIMQHAQLLELVRQRVRAAFKAQAVEDIDDCCETILIRDGFYCGRCFACDNHRAIWFVEESVIKFYGTDGKFLTSQAIEEGRKKVVA